jgi:peptidoglycan hydrolase CwlO-like protein
VELLKGLADQAEKEGKKEEDLYETYVCWAKTVIDTKTATNAAAESRIDELETYIADLDAGRIELTSERVDLEKEIKGLLQELEAMEAQRNKERADFEEAEKEMNQAIAALGKAVRVLGKATEDHKEGTLLQAKVDLSEGFAERAAEAAALQQAVELGERFLGKGDALFLRRVLTGEVPKADWKKLNRKATFKMAYKARSFKIQDVLSKMLGTFKTNLKDATDKEQEAQTQYDELSGSKSEQLGEAQQALSKMDGEKGAKAMSKEDSQKEVDALKLQVTNDKKFIEQTATALEEKKQEWKDRQQMRTGEIAAINKAVSILHSDDARDTFKKSFTSQSFLQTGATQQLSVAQVLKKAAQQSGDGRLALLASRVSKTDPLATGSHFDKVIAAIDKMIGTLQGEEKTDLENKEVCEKDRADDTRTAIKAGRTMDEHTDTITELKARIAEIEINIEENNKEIANLDDELEQATKDRTDAHAAWANNNADDEAAAALVIRAKDVLANFYKENELMFVQNKMDPVVAGEAPPPPPKTWEDPYGGKTEEATGIVAILEMIHEDIEKDRAKAKTEEGEDQTAFDNFKTNTESQIQALTDSNNSLKGEKGDKEDDVSSNKKDRLSQKGELDAVLKKISDATPGCDYLTINYEVRLKNRQIEIDGLVKAKAILEGGEFPSFLEGNQEKSGDAFLQRRK